MKKHILLFAAMMFCIMLSAQTQQGYVKIKGRLANDGSVIAGTRIPNATIQVKDRTPVVSQDNGTFSFPIPSKNFYLTKIQKQGYVLTDPEVLSKQYSYSKNDLIIVMEDLAQQEADRRAIERKISSKLYAQLQQRSEELESLKEQNKITEEKYRELLQKLNKDQDDNEKIIKEMAERYIKMDFDQINEFNRKVSKYILNGELMKADSMLNSKGNLTERSEQLKRERAANAKEKEELDRRQTNLQQSEAYTQAKLEDLANDCYNKFEIFKMMHENDSAAYYMELRAGLDKTNTQWALDAGAFLYSYFADYENALAYYHSGLKQSLDRNGLLSELTSFSYNNIGTVYDDMGQYDTALYYLQKALSIDTTLFGEYNSIVASTYDNLGIVYSNLGEFDKALLCHEKAININRSMLSDDNLELERCYNNIGTIYCYLDKYDDALEAFQEALRISAKNSNENSFETADVYNNIGGVYSAKHDYATAMEYYTKSLSIKKTVLSGNHPDIARSYNNIGINYLRSGNPSKGLEYLENALSMRRSLFGEYHAAVADSYNNLGGAYSRMNNTDKELEYYEKALSIRKIILDENHPDIALSYNNIGSLYIKLGQYEKAIEYLNKALSIRESVFGEQHSTVAWTLYNLGGAYSESDNYEKGIECFERCLEIRSAVLGDDHPYTIQTQQKIDEIQAKLKEQENQSNE